MNIYEPCSCGSGKKLKFCCFEKRSTLDLRSPTGLLKQSSEFPIYQCLIDDGWEERGLAQVLVVRQMHNLKYLYALYLVDIFCLGVKNTFYEINIKQDGVNALISRLSMGTEVDLIKISYQDCRSLVLGAVDFAAQLGFKPNRDWADSKHVIESELPYEHKFQFGRDGKPFYVEGPDDNIPQILSTLKPLIKREQADIMCLSEGF